MQVGYRNDISTEDYNMNLTEEERDILDGKQAR